MKRKCLAVGIILLFVGTCTIPSVTSEQTYDKNIITVDDEPGDADFTSIKEAVNSSSPGDTIEVYSGTYPEDGIRIVKDNITLLGISHELGEGDDSGKPFIKGDGTALVIHVEASHVIVSNLLIENPWAGNLTSYACISVGNKTVAFYEVIERNNITISDCIIRNTPVEGISVGDVGKNIRIINNVILNCTYGISTVRVTHKFWMTITITGNVITDCFIVGIIFDRNQQNISGNKIRRCGTGIDLYPPGSNNIVYGNDIENCPVGVISRTGRNTITKNNFKNYSWIGCWFKRTFYIYFPGLGLIDYLYQKDKWLSNYWDTWTGIGSKKILGTFDIWRIIFGYAFHIKIPWVDRDWNPAKEPYDIPGMS
jgi:parallel beta-helix repeat protein